MAGRSARVCTLVGMLACAGWGSAAPQKPLVKPPPGRVAPAPAPTPTPAPAERPADTPADAPAPTPPPAEAPAAPAPTTPEGELALAKTRVVELHVARIGQVLEECRRAGSLDAARAAALRAALPDALSRDVVASWHRPSPADLDLAAVEVIDFEVRHAEPARVVGVAAVAEVEVIGGVQIDPVVGIAAPMEGRESQDIAHSTLRGWLSSEAWPALLAAHVTPDEALAVQQALTARSAAVTRAEAAFLEARLARGLCLTDEERLTLRAPLEAFVQSRPHDMVDTHRVDHPTTGHEEELLRSLSKHRVTEVLSEARRKALSGLLDSTRSPEDDLAVEIDHLVSVHRKGDRERELLRGFAQTLVERNVVRKKAVPGRGMLAPVSDLDTIELWSKGLRGVLDLPDDTEFSLLPSRLLSPVCDARAELFLAVLDDLACLDAEQRVTARSILREFVELEANDKREGFNIAVAPRAFGLRCDGMLGVGRADFADALSAEQRAAVKRLHALLTSAQREVALR